ncbi:hypothetical protein EXIGLDRAFT_844187 [Exidia glandulosa HHB12029]|uniref:Uncharacterized protein n=1 Tax=Exidia glandulosa HHB12029 TaxID=1314781 RepID=A0A165C6L6_EXIGL|nr:hypothetical protein EXIGLDRAFT_844187 [Exidia glandulosa HHB12029]
MNRWWLLVALTAALCVQLVLNVRLSYSVALSHPKSDFLSLVRDSLANDIVIQLENSVHYPVDGAFADEGWASLVPGNGTVRVNGTPYLLGVFHELRCLDLLRRQLRDTATVPFNVSSPAGRRARHCMQYLRQMVLCRANTRLELVTGLYEEHNVIWEQDYVCRDRRGLYAAVKLNQAGL